MLCVVETAAHTNLTKCLCTRDLRPYTHSAHMCVSKGVGRGGGEGKGEGEGEEEGEEGGEADAEAGGEEVEKES